MIKALTSKVQNLSSNISLLRILSLIWEGSKKWTIIAILFIIAESALFFSSLYMLKMLIDTISKHALGNIKDEPLVLKYVLLAMASAILYAWIKSISSYFTEKQSGKVAEFLDDKIHRCVNELDLSFYERSEYYDTLKRARDMGTDRPNLIVYTIVDIFKNAISLVLISSMLVSIDWRLFPVLALFLLPTLWVRITFADSQNALRIAQTALERKSNYTSSLLTSDILAKEIRIFGLGDYVRARYAELRKVLLSSRLKLSFARIYKELITSAISTIGFFACIGYIAIGSIKGFTTIGDISLFLVAFPQSFNIMQTLSTGITTLYQNNIFVKSVFELFDLKSSIVESPNPIPIPKDEQIDLQLNNVSFTYANSNKTALKDINLILPAGKIVALVGLNGAGKSTLMKVMCRLYEPTAGSITMNGVDIRSFNSKDYYKEVCAVFQDFGKYNMSVEDNIRFGDIHRETDQTAIREAAKNSGANLYIDTFPQGYATIMGRMFDDGHEVSIGQWQKLAIARAFYSKSRFVILDEATSALDATAEKELFDSFRERIGNRAALIISHRQSAVKHADFIYMLSEGRITESGTHEELVALKGQYYRLFNNNSIIE
jgi:ATP-binding cassette subfamily B protein